MLGKRKNTRDGRPLDTGKPTRRPPNKYAAAAAMLSSATPLFLGYDLAVVYCTAVTAQGDVRLLACVIALSLILGAIAAAGAQRVIGDRRAVLLSAAVLCAGALARSLAGGFAAFTAGVFINGVGMGLALMVVPFYAAELSLTSARGVLASHPDGFVYLGCILGSLCYSMGFSKLPAHVAWRVTVPSGTAIPALLGAAVLLMPESPRWLVAVDRESKARRVLSRTSATLEEAELRLLEIKSELGKHHHHDDDGSFDEPTVAMSATPGRWREEIGILRELLARPTEPVRRAVLTALVSKVFQQASGVGSILQYVQRAFRDAGVSPGAQTPRALAVFGLVVVMSFPMSLVLVELCWLLVRALASGLRRRAPSPAAHRSGPSQAGVTRRQEQQKWARGLSATMLLSLMALVWIALGPAPWADVPSRGCPRWLRAAAAAANRAVSSAILSSFGRVYRVAAVYGNLIMCHSVIVVFMLFACGRLLGSKVRGESC
ncbi:hypothetical protein PAHAL_2G427200 [Panicum hallii]|uniref:Major facilitator superfamily (MFS) profile domain-containing protein n=1 Tax=Panicum hallii TaxID=206008 RepID=A0A2S3H3P2_9POAL|nr:polyol transporter 5-like [Panicum hallii]PAN14654.1 hypothetical protein PAHAL_2G427200 [Panicum hallii]